MRERVFPPAGRDAHVWEEVVPGAVPFVRKSFCPSAGRDAHVWEEVAPGAVTSVRKSFSAGGP